MMPSGRGLPPPLTAPRAVSAAAEVPLSRRPSPGPGSSRLLQALLPLQAAPASCNRQIAEAGGDIQGIKMLKPQGPHSRAQPAHRLRVAQLLWVSEDRLVHSWLKSPGPRRHRFQPTPWPPGRRLKKALQMSPCPEQI